MNIIEKITNIYEQKTNYLLPENLRENTYYLGINGTLTTGTSVKMFDSIENMSSDPNKEVGQLAVVYSKTIKDVGKEDIFKTVKLLETITFSQTVTSFLSFYIESANPSVYVDAMGSLTPNGISIEIYGPSDMEIIEYFSTDGKTYSRAYPDDEYTFPAEVQFSYFTKLEWDMRFGEIFKVQTNVFQGLHECQKILNTSSNIMNYDLEYVYKPAQLTATKEAVLDSCYLGLNGLEMGELDNYNNLSVKSLNILQNIYTQLNNGVTIGKDMSYMFAEETAMSTLNLTNTINIRLSEGLTRNLSHTFYNCANLSNIANLTNFSVSDLNSTFYQCRKLSSLAYLETLNTTNLTSLDSTFALCMNVQSLSPINNWDTSNVIDMSYAFYTMQNLTSLTPLSNWNTVNVKSLAGTFSTMFTNGSNITKLQGLENWQTSNVTNIHRIFYQDSKLTNINALQSWDTSNVIDMSEAFLDLGFASSQVNIHPISNWNTSSVTNMSSMFESALIQNLQEISNWDTSNVTNMCRTLRCRNTVSQPTMLNWDTSKVTSLNLFCPENTTSLNFISNFNTSKVIDMSMLAYYTKIQTLSPIANWDTSNVTNIEGLCCGCENLSNIEAISNWNLSKVVDISGMFLNCKPLTNALPLSNQNLENVKSIYQMFSNCLNLVDVPEMYMPNVEGEGPYKMFERCNNLSNESIQNIINMCLNINPQTLSWGGTLKTNSAASPFYNTNITSDRYQNRLTELTQAGWSY